MLPDCKITCAPKQQLAKASAAPTHLQATIWTQSQEARRSECGHVCCLQGARRPFVAFFGSAGTGGRSRVHAWLSHSTRGLRSLLRSPPHGLTFSMPLASEADAAESTPAQCGTAAAQFYGQLTAVRSQGSGSESLTSWWVPECAW